LGFDLSTNIKSFLIKLNGALYSKTLLYICSVIQLRVAASALDNTVKSDNMIKITDITKGTQIQLSNKNVFMIEEMRLFKDFNLVVSTLNNGSKGNYVTELNEALEFFNDNDAIVLS